MAVSCFHHYENANVNTQQMFTHSAGCSIELQVPFRENNPIRKDKISIIHSCRELGSAAELSYKHADTPHSVPLREESPPKLTLQVSRRIAWEG